MKPLRLAGIVLGSAAVALALTTGACGYEVPDVGTGTPDSGLGPDVTLLPDAADSGAAADAKDAAAVDDGSCNPAKAFGTPVLVQGLADPGYDERFPRLTPDELRVYYALAPKNNGMSALFTATRASPTGGFGPPVAVAGLTGGTGSDNNITVSADGLWALISSNRTQQSVNPNVSQIWATSRASAASPFAAPNWTNTGWGSQNGDFDPYFVPGAGNLFYSANMPFNGTAAHIRRAVLLDPTSSPPSFGNAPPPDFSTGNAAAEDRAPVVTADELRIYFASNSGPSGGTMAGGNIWTSTRVSKAVGWVAPTMVSELAGFGTYPRPGWISPDDCRLYLWSNKAGSEDVYVATRGK